MKTILALSLALAAFGTAQAQVFRPAAVNGALLGGVAGAIIGHNSGNHNAWRGAAIGATAGLIVGSAIDADHRYPNQRNVWHRSGAPAPRGYVYRNGPTYRPHRPYPYRGGYYYSRPNYYGNGVFLGGVSGAIVGHNSRAFRHDAWRGAAWGAGLGYVFGSIAEDNARYRQAIVERVPVVQQVPVEVAEPSAPPQQVTIINNYYNTPATPMSAANGLFGR